MALFIDANILREIKELTDLNDASSAYILAAQSLGCAELESKFKNIQREQTRLGYLPYLLDQECYGLYKMMMEYAKARMSVEDYKKFYMLF